MFEHPVPDDHLREVGDIVVSFSNLENSWEFLVASLLTEDFKCNSVKAQHIGQMVCAEMSFKNIRNLAMSLCSYRFGENSHDTNELYKLHTKSSDCEDLRNRIMHSDWGISGSKVSISKITAKAKKGLTHLHTPASLSTLHDLAMKCKQAAGEVGSWRMLREEEGRLPKLY